MHERRKEENQKLEEVRRIAARNPSQLARLLKNWLSQEKKKENAHG